MGLRHSVYNSSFEADGAFVPRVMHYVRPIVAAWWFFMGCVTISGARRASALEEEPQKLALTYMVMWVALFMILMSFMMFVHSFWILLESSHLLAWGGMSAVLNQEQAHLFDVFNLHHDIAEDK